MITIQVATAVAMTLKQKAVFYCNDFAQKLNFYFDVCQHNLRNNLNGHHVNK